MQSVEKKLVFNAGVEELKRLIDIMDGGAEWHDLSNGIQYRSAVGGVLNYYPGTGTILFQGSECAKRDLQAEFTTLLRLNDESLAKNAISHIWPNIDFGKYSKSKMSLPEIVLHDPGWFFFLYADGKCSGRWREHLLFLAERAQAIALPRDYVGGRVRHNLRPYRTYGGFSLVEKKDLKPAEPDIPSNSSSLDLSYPWRTFGKDMIAQLKLLRSFNKYYVESGQLKLTKGGIEQFFDDDRNFDL